MTGGTARSGGGDKGAAELPSLPWEGWTSTAAGSEPRQAPDNAPELVYLYVPGAETGSAAAELAKHFEAEIFAKPRVQRLAESFRCLKEPASGDAWAEFDAATEKAEEPAKKDKSPRRTDARATSDDGPMPKLVLRDCRGTVLREFTKKTEWRAVAGAMEAAIKKNKAAAARP